MLRSRLVSVHLLDMEHQTRSAFGLRAHQPALQRGVRATGGPQRGPKTGRPRAVGPSALDCAEGWADAPVMDYPALTNLDGTPIDDRPWNPLRGRWRILLLFFGALAADVAMRLASLLMSGLPPLTFLPLMTAGWITGLCALLTPVAVVARTPDAWASHRPLLVGVLLVATGELLSAANYGVFALNWWFLPGGLLPDLFDRLMYGVSSAQSLVAIGASVLIGLALVKARSHPVPRRGWLLIGGVLVVCAAVRLFALSGFGVDGQSLLTAALLGLATLAGIYQMSATLAGWFAGESPRRPWALASAGVILSILASLLLFVQPVVGDLALVGFAVAATAGAILTLFAFADGLGAKSDRETALP